ncbi:hypothetical protein CASFOL_035575 [Castilleja foliolosa]|uniref:Pseudouridine synthase RsuA/RluA-like domain-containing protein n=1 Tax=Castilleja foliolosa TaxID=1961234 RepID=A0ABD3BT76_9LAMI
MTRTPLCFRAPVLLKVSKPLGLSSMAAEAHLENYPVPLSPPPPLISKDIELNRALTASSKSSLFCLSRKDVIFEDDWIIAVNKPQGIYCETLLSSAHTLLNTNQEDKLVLQELHLSNRLDRDTSGVTVITKSHKVAAKLVKAFTEHTVKKTYLASCVGKAPSWENMIIKSGHGRSKHGAWRVYACSDVGRSLPGGSYVRDMETSFQLLSINGRGLCEGELSGSEKLIVVEEKSEIDSSSYTEKEEVMVRAYPRSGRTHQIRLHCQYLGISIRGDVKYDGVYEWKDKIYEGHELHAESLSFEHPVTGVPILIQAPLPVWASQALTQISS